MSLRVSGRAGRRRRRGYRRAWPGSADKDCRRAGARTLWDGHKAKSQSTSAWLGRRTGPGGDAAVARRSDSAMVHGFCRREATALLIPFLLVLLVLPAQTGHQHLFPLLRALHHGLRVLEIHCRRCCLGAERACDGASHQTASPAREQIRSSASADGAKRWIEKACVDGERGRVQGEKRRIKEDWSEARHAEECQNLEFTRKIILEMTQAINDLTIEITPRGPCNPPVFIFAPRLGLSSPSQNPNDNSLVCNGS